LFHNSLFLRRTFVQYAHHIPRYSHMKYLLPIALLLVFFTSCDDLSKQVITTEYSKEIYHIDSDSLKQGSFVELTLEGDTISKAYFLDNKLNGKRFIYSENGKIQVIEHYKNDLFHGPIITYHENGNEYTKGNYTNNQLDPEFFVYYESGELKEKVTMKDNEENGPFEEYYQSGQLHWKGTFINGPNEVGELLD